MAAVSRRALRLASAGACAVVACTASPSVLVAQERAFTLQGYSRVTGIPTIGTVADFAAVVGGVKVNPFRYDCVANLEIVNASGQQVRLAGQLRPDQVKILPNGEARNARTAELVALRDSTRRIVVRLSMNGDPDRVAFRVEGAQPQGEAGGDALADLQSEEFDIPDDVRRRCGSEPRFNVDLQNPTSGSDGLAVNLDLVKRVPFEGAGGGLWQFALSGSALDGDSAVTLDSWKGEGRVQWNVSPWPDRWIGLGLNGRLEASEDLETLNGLVGAALEVRLDFLGLDELLAPLVARFTPYPIFVAEYFVTSDVRTPTPSPGVEAVSRPVNNRLDLGVDWRVPFLFQTTVDLKIQGSYLFGDLPAGVDERWQMLRDISVEYPLNSAGDIVAVLTRLSGETAPRFTNISRHFLGIGIRR